MATVTELSGAPAPAPLPAVPEAGGGDAANGKNDNWRFLEPQPIREDQVINAVNFLAHPKVKGSPVVYRRSFLEQKGLSREEIDEAFRRCPDPPSGSSTNTVPTAAGQTGAINPPRQVGQPVGPNGQAIITGQQTPAKSTSWAQMLLALGCLTAAGAGAGVLTKKYFIPKLKEWILEIANGKSMQAHLSKKPSPMEEATNAAAAAAAAAATAATQMAAALQDLAKSRSEDRIRQESLIRAMEGQTLELKNTLAGMRDAVQIAEVTKYQRSVTSDFQANGVATSDHLKGQANGAGPTFATESRIVNTRTTNFGALPDPSSGVYDNVQQAKSLSPSPANGQIHAPHSQSYLEVMAILERGEKPPGIREVNDKPPNPSQPPSNPRLQPRPKPWKKAAVEDQSMSPIISNDAGQPRRYQESWNAGSSIVVQPNVSTDFTGGSVTGSSSEPWWRKKVDTDGIFPSSVKITEVDVASEVDIGTVQVGEPSSLASFGPSGGGRAGWVPPPVPQPMYPGAEEAIKRLKTMSMGTSARNMASPAENGSAPDTFSSSQRDEHPVQVITEALDDSTELNNQLPEQVDESPVEQEPDYTNRSLAHTTPAFKDLEEEGGQP